MVAAAAALLAQGASARPDPLVVPSWATLDTHGAKTLVLTTDTYRLKLSKQTGEILELFDRVTGTRIVDGQAGCLWGARAAGERAWEAGERTYLGGCAYGPAGGRFSYRWDGGSATLTLVYGGATGVDAVATIRSADSTLDLQLAVKNGQPRPLTHVLFPSDLRVRVSRVAAGYAPTFLPGTRLRRGFFERVGGNVNTYPSRWAFSDFLALDLAPSRLSLYSLNPPPRPLAPVNLGFTHGDAGECGASFFCVTHAFETWVREGEAWTSPVVRFRFGASAAEGILDYRRGNGIDSYPSLEAKIGPRLGAIVRAPLVKADLWKGLRPFAEWGPDLGRLPSPALLHPVAFQSGGFDVSDPDFLPPDPLWGSAADFRSMVGGAHSRGQFVMPYLNASWWGDESPTIRALTPPLTPRDVAVQDEEGKALVEDYGGHRGYVVSPFVPFVRQRFARLMDEWRTDVPVDCLFFDQIGARPWVRDFNPAAPSPIAYADGWLQLSAPYADRCLMVEDGWDRLGSMFAGFHGGLLLMEKGFDEPNRFWGAGNWEPYPLALWLLHDKVLLYQHDLFDATMTDRLDVLTWNVAFGFMLSYTWSGWTESLASPWLDVVGTFQRVLGPRYAGQQFGGYEELPGGATATTFGDLRVMANWGAGPFDAGDAVVAPGGFVARAPGILAGVFTGSFGGAPLSAGLHYLIVEEQAGVVTVRQPLGDDTPLSITWPTGRGVQAAAYTADGRPLGEAAGEIRDGRFVFHYRRSVGGERVAFYRVG